MEELEEKKNNQKKQKKVQLEAANWLSYIVSV